MIKSRNEIIETIRKLCEVNSRSKENIRQFAMALKNNYNIPLGMATDILTLNNDLKKCSDFVLFCVLEVVNVGYVEGYFTPSEIKEYSKAKYKDEGIRFPIKFNMIQIDDDQWIGKISVKELMQLRDAQLIYYNENTQRTLQRVLKGNVEHFKIRINRQAVDGIQESMSNETYIPNTITLNMPEDTIYSFKENQLIIENLSKFDILDGYHRYIAISGIYNLNPLFDYNMELRIVCFQEGKAKQFVWQEDQKTKMRKVDSESFNQNSEANKVVQRLNSDSTFILAGQLSRNEGIINSAEMALLIKLLWFNDKREQKSSVVKKGIQIKDKLQEKIEVLVKQEPTLLEKTWSFKYLSSVLACIYKDVPNEKMSETVNKVYRENEDFNMTSSRCNRTTLRRFYGVI